MGLAPVADGAAPPAAADCAVPEPEAGSVVAGDVLAADCAESVTGAVLLTAWS
jgi:hypothetical protein